MIKKITKYLITFFISIYDIFIGFISPFFIMYIALWFSNHPKGPGYSVPKDEFILYKFLSIIILFFYIAILSPSYYYIKKNYSNKKIILFQVIFIFIGISIYFIFIKTI